MKRKTKTKTKTKIKKKIQRGGAINCEAEGFTREMREATFGRDYPTAIVSHQNSEQWNFDQLVDISSRGIVSWYCKKAGLTPEECFQIISMPEVQILGAFFHRYKVFSEHISITKRALTNNLKGYGPSFLDVKEKFYKRLLASNKEEDKKLLEDYQFVESYLNGNPNYENFRVMDLPIERAIDRAQCLLWVIVKNKRLPDGFVMDEKIQKRALEPIIFKEGRNDYGGNIKMMPFSFITIPQIINLIRRVENDSIELEDVTFGVY